MRQFIAAAAALALGLAGCAKAPEPPSFPMTGEPPVITETSAGDIAADLAQLIAGQLKPADGTLAISGDSPPIDKKLAVVLKANGFRLAARGAKHTATYTIAPLGPTLLLRLRIDGLQAARLYRSGAAGEILPASPTSLTQG